jgi:hypothetical protein
MARIMTIGEILVEIMATERGQSFRAPGTLVGPFPSGAPAIFIGDVGQEDVKKLISLGFRDFIFDPKCLPTSQRSLLGHPGAAFFGTQLSQQLKINFFTSSRRT